MEVAREVAEAEFNRWADSFCLDVDTSKLDPEDLKSFEQQKSHIVKAIERGDLIVDDNDQPVYTPVAGDNKTPITFYEPTGATFMAMDGKKKNADMSKFFAAIGDMTRQPPGRFGLMKGRDLKVCIALATLFLAG